MKMLKKCSLLLLSLVAITATAEELVVESFDSNGTLVFNQISNAVNYRIEWASSPSGPWTNSWEHLSTIQPDASGSVTCKVAMCYRVVADIQTNVFQNTVWDMSLPEGSDLKLYSDGKAELIEYGKDEYGSYPVIGSGLKIYSGTYSASSNSLSATVVVDWRIFDPTDPRYATETITIEGSLVDDSQMSGTGNYVDTDPDDLADIDFDWTATKSNEPL